MKHYLSLWLVGAFMLNGWLAPADSQVLDRFAAAMDAQDVQALQSLYSPQVDFADINLRTHFTNSQTLLEHFGQFWRAHEAFSFKVLDSVLQDGQAALKVEWTGTIVGALFPDEKPRDYTIGGVMLLEIEDGKITRQRDYIDLRTYIELFGMPPSH